MSGSSVGVQELIGRMTAAFVRDRDAALEESLRRKATELNYHGAMSSGSGYLQMREVLESEIRERAHGLWRLTKRIHSESRSTIDKEVASDLKESIRQQMEDLEAKLSERLSAIAKTTGATDPEPLTEVIAITLEDVHNEIDLAVLTPATEQSSSDALNRLIANRGSIAERVRLATGLDDESLHIAAPYSRQAQQEIDRRHREAVLGQSGHTEQTGQPMSPRRPVLKLFISHSSADADLVSLLIDLIRSALSSLKAEEIRCSSVDGYRLPGGADTDELLRQEVHDSVAFIGVISQHSVSSMYVAFELGARWGGREPLLPAPSPGVNDGILTGPLTGLNALHLGSAGELHQLVTELGQRLEVGLEPAASYQKRIDAVLNYKGPAEASPSDSGDPLSTSVDDDEQLDDSDILAVLKDYINHSEKELHKFSEVDRELKLPKGAAKRLLVQVAREWLDVDEIGPNFVKFKTKGDGYEPDDFYNQVR